jgi:hypothetical protein
MRSTTFGASLFFSSLLECFLLVSSLPFSTLSFSPAQACLSTAFSPRDFLWTVGAADSQQTSDPAGRDSK